MAAGEEKTIYTLPKGYGYPIGANDTWLLNYMIHDLTDRGATVYITYDIDFVPADSPAAANDQARPSDLDGRSRPQHSTRCSTSSATADATASTPIPTWLTTHTATDRR